MADRTSTYSMRTNTSKNAACRTNVADHNPIHSKDRINASSHEPNHSKARINWFIFGSWSVVLLIGLALWAGVIALFM